MLKKKKILITGAAGFIGSNLLRRCLEENAEVYILSIKPANKWRLENVLSHVQEHCVNLLDLDLLEKTVASISPEIIFHMAAYGVYSSQKDVKKIIETNLLGTINLVNICKKTGFELFVNTGSVFEYGIKNSPLKESDMLEPISDYGISKAAATLYCQAVAKKENRPVVTLRLFTPYGYYEEPPRLVPSVILSCLNGENPKLSSPGSMRDFIFIEDVVDAYIKAAENVRKVSGEILNIGSGKQCSVGEVVNTILQYSGNSVIPQWDSFSDNRIESKMLEADILKAERMLNWRPNYSLQQGLEKSVKWFKENIGLYKKHKV